jgi:hypothetical protein
MRALLANLFDFSPIRMAARAMSGGASTAALSLVPDPELEPDPAADETPELPWAVILFGADNGAIDHLVVAPFATATAAEDWARLHDKDARYGWEIAPLRAPGSAAP